MVIIRHQFGDRGLGRLLSGAFNGLMWGEPLNYPFTNRSETIVVAGDFSGSHRKTGYQVYSFLIMDLERNQKWIALQSLFRTHVLNDRRRISFKSLRDTKRVNVLPQFLTMANEIEGWLVSFCLTRRVKSIFQDELHEGLPIELRGIWKTHIVEEVLRVLHFSSFLLTGLSRPGQNLLHIVDQDAIASNFAQLNKLTLALGNVWSNYASHSLGHIRCGTTQHDDGSLSLEDLTAIPDLAAGAICEIASEMMRTNQNPKKDLLTPFPKTLSDKAKYIATWLAYPNSSLRRATCFIDADDKKIAGKMVRWHAVRGRPITS